MSLILVVSSCGDTGLRSWSPAGHHAMACTPVLHLSKVYRNEKVLCVCTVQCCAFTKAVFENTFILVGLLCEKNIRSPR